MWDVTESKNFWNPNITEGMMTTKDRAGIALMFLAVAGYQWWVMGDAIAILASSVLLIVGLAVLGWRGE